MYRHSLVVNLHHRPSNRTSARLTYDDKSIYTRTSNAFAAQDRLSILQGKPMRIFPIQRDTQQQSIASCAQWISWLIASPSRDLLCEADARTYPGRRVWTSSTKT